MTTAKPTHPPDIIAALVHVDHLLGDARHEIQQALEGATAGGLFDPPTAVPFDTTVSLAEIRSSVNTGLEAICHALVLILTTTPSLSGYVGARVLAQTHDHLVRAVGWSASHILPRTVYQDPIGGSRQLLSMTWSLADGTSTSLRLERHIDPHLGWWVCLGEGGVRCSGPFPEKKAREVLGAIGAALSLMNGKAGKVLVSDDGETWREAGTEGLQHLGETP